jgi:hypothetical protein
MSGRAKWDAWKSAAETYEGHPSEAEHRYMDVARNLGWKEGVPAAVTDETEERVEGGSGSGMGVSVSVISSPQLDEEAATGLHAYAIRDDVAAMSAFLQAGEGLDIDARDEYVSKASFFLVCFFDTSYHLFVGIHRTAFGCRPRERRHRRAFTQARRR